MYLFLYGYLVLTEVITPQKKGTFSMSMYRLCAEVSVKHKQNNNYVSAGDEIIYPANFRNLSDVPGRLLLIIYKIANWALL